MSRLLAPALLALLFAGCSPAPSAFKATDISTVPWGNDFTLTAHTGERVRLSSYQGKVVTLFFGFTHCPDICGPTLAKLAAAMKQLGDEAGDVQVLFVTIDPAHDTPQQLAGFVPKFDARFVGLTGMPEEIAAAAQEYKVAFAQGTGADEKSIQHTGGIFIKDRQGRLRLYANEDARVEDLVHDLRLLLRSR